MFSPGSLIQEAVWQKILLDLTKRSYKEVPAQISKAHGLEKTTVSDHFIEASRRLPVEVSISASRGCTWATDAKRFPSDGD